MPFEQIAHLAELGEHQGLIVAEEDVVDQLVEASELAAASGEPRLVGEGLCRMVADLLQTGERGEHDAAPLDAGLLVGVASN